MIKLSELILAICISIICTFSGFRSLCAAEDYVAVKKEEDGGLSTRPEFRCSRANHKVFENH